MLGDEAYLTAYNTGQQKSLDHTVTYALTDIEGSTKLAQQYPEAMAALLARHHEILHECIQMQNGYIFQIIGDAFCVAFSSAMDALNVAIDAQRCLYNEPWSPAPIKVRMGIHTGTAQLISDGQYSGYATLALSQRIMSAGHGGQILLSSSTRELVRDTLPKDCELLDLGDKRLKDLLRPEHFYQLNVSGLPSIFQPLKTLDSSQNNLPTQLTTFIGREDEIAELKQELNKRRLVTLTGSGGTGKTRLALQVAADLLEEFDHGIWFVELAPLTDPDLIPQTILSAIGIQEQQGKVPLEFLKEYLHDKKTLIVLDNCEHLIEDTARVVNTLLNAAQNLKILASSREALGVKGELSYPVPSLSMPDIKQLPVIEQFSQYEAVRLFIDRASLVSPHFDVDEENAPAIARICNRLDGIPLAIELAAARVKVMSVEQISMRIDNRFLLLTGGARTSLPRQQTLRALIDWSYDLLSENERLLLLRLSAFAGSWTLEAAEEVCSGDDIESFDVLDLLTQLVNKSLVVMIEHSKSGESRYRMLETIRQYAREKLLETRSSEIVRDRHLAYYVKLAEQAEPELYRSNQIIWLNKLEDEFDNLHTALDWALATDVESGLRIASILWRFWDSRGHLQELGGWLSQFLDGYNTIDRLHALTLGVYALLLFRKSNFTESIQYARRGLQMARTLSDKQLEAFSLSLLGVIIQLQGKVGEGIPLLEQGLALHRAVGDKIGQANTLEWLSYDHTDLERAIAFAKESLRIHRELNNLIGIENILVILARLTLWNGDFSSADPWLAEALTISNQLGDQATEISILISFGILAHWQGDHPKAIAHFEEAILLSEKIGDQYQNLWTHVRMAHTLLRQGDIQQARTLFTGSLENKHMANFTIALVYAIEGLASVNVIQGQPERATRLFAWADTTRAQIGDHRPPVEQVSIERDLKVIHSQISDIAYENAYESGKSMDVAQAIAIALEENPK